MSLVRWFRKNNSKVMAVVVIVLMIAFVGGTSLMQLVNSGTGLNTKVAYIDGGITITERDRVQATRELELLKALGADRILKVLPVTYFNTVDLHSYLLSELLFSEQNASPEYAIYAREIVARNLYEVSEEQINDIYRRSVASDLYWYCLKHEAHSAGIRIRNEAAGQLLGAVIPRLFNNMTYSQVIESLVNRTGTPEEKILSSFADLLSILRYSHLICSNENMTTRQLKQAMARDQESIDVELVEFGASIFSQQQEEPSEEQVDEQFNKYKNSFPGFISEENPYGFGYKQPERVQLEYIAVRLSDVSKIAKKPTQDEMEEYYSNNKSNLFAEQVLSDPNDPNSPMTAKIKLYSEVASLISRELSTSKINDQAESIIQEAFTLAEAPFREIENERLVELSGDELAEIAEDYGEIAERLSEKYGIEVASGRTGLLSGSDVLSDEYLSRLYFEGYGQISVYLSKVIFAVEELGISDLGPYEMSAPKLYENIGLAKDTSMEIDVPGGKVVALIRVVDVVEASMPESVDTVFNMSSIVFDPNETESDENTSSIREAVIEDLKKLSAMETAKSKAEEFLEMAEEDDWENVVEKFNELYGEQQDPNDPNLAETLIAEETFKLQNQTNLRAMPQVIMNVLDRQHSNNPTGRLLMADYQRSNLLMEKLVSLVPTDSNDADIFPLIVEFKPDMIYFCIKELKINRLWKEVYDNSKSSQLYTQEHVQSQSLAAVHYNPENILKRMNFEVIQEEETEEITSTTESEESP